MRSGSLFAGIGGFDLGFQQAGIETVWQVENDPDCNSVLERHWPHVKRYGDVCDVGKSNLEPVDLVCGGFPCQDVSLAGNRAGLSGERSGLFWQAHRILAELHPACFVIENVPGLYSSKRLDKKDPLGEGPAVDDDGVGSFLESKDFGIVINSLVDIGYCVAWRCLDAEYFGVAQRRRRLFVVASFRDGTSAAEILFEPESSTRDTPPRREAGQGVTRTLTSSPGRSKFDLDRGLAVPQVAAVNYSRIGKGGFTDPVNDNIIPVAYALGGREPAGRQEAEANLIVAHCLRAEGADASEDGTGRGTPLIVDDVSPTVEAHWAVRRLTPTECERLQGFPDGWTAYDDQGKPISDSARYRMLGNAVAVPVAAWIGKRVVAALAGKRE